MQTQTGCLGVREDKSSCMVVMPKRFHRSMLYSSSFSALGKESDIDNYTHTHRNGNATCDFRRCRFLFLVFRCVADVADQGSLASSLVIFLHQQG